LNWSSENVNESVRKIVSTGIRLSSQIVQ